MVPPIRPEGKRLGIKPSSPGTTHGLSFLAPFNLTVILAIGGNVVWYDVPSSVGGLNWNCRCHVLKDSLLLASLLVFIVAVTAMAMIVA
jgi:hypothetical protein